MEEGASNVKENVALNRPLEDLRLKTDPSILKLFPKPKSVDSDTLRNLFKMRESNLKSPNTNNSQKGLGIAEAFKKVPEFKLNPTVKKFSESKPLRPLDLTLPKWSSSKYWNVRNYSNYNNRSPSIVDEHFEEVTKGKNIPRLGLPSLLPIDLSATRKAPFAFKNLLKLKDVELMSPKSNKVKIELPFFKPVSRAIDKLISPRVNTDCDTDLTSKQNNDQLIPRGKKIKTEILDALPSASENTHVITANENSLQQQDGLLNAFENNQEITADENSLEQQDSLVENANENVDTGTDQQIIDDSEAGNTNREEIWVELNQNVEQTPTQQLSKAPEGVEQDLDSFDDSFEFIIDENDASGIDQIIFDIGNEPLNSEININEVNIPGNEEINENFDVTGLDIDESFFSRGPEFGEIVNEDEKIISGDHVVDPDSFILEKVAEKEPDTIADFSSAAKCDCEAKNIPEKENHFMKENRNVEISKQEKLPRRNMLPKLRDSIVLTLHNLRKPNGKILSLSRLTKHDDKNIIENNERSSLDGTSAVEPTMTTIVGKFAQDIDDGISTKDLQDMSDSLLHRSYTDPNVRASNNLECKADIHRAQSTNDPTQLDDENETFGDNSDEDTNLSDLETLDSTHHTDIVETFTNLNVPLEQNEINANNDVANVDFNQDEGSTCQGHLNSFKSATSEKLATESKLQEMEVGASEPRPSVFPTLTQQVLEPSSLFDSSILNPPVLPNLGDLLNGNTQLPSLPSLDDITSSISNLFEGNKKANSEVEEELSSSEFDTNSDCTDNNPDMFTDASTTNLKSTLSELQNPFENINLDIFQLSPLPQSSPLAYKIPSLNLNLFKTKLAVPKKLDFRPVKLQSSLGKDGSLLGATLTFENPELGALNARKPIFGSSVLNSKPSVILGDSLGNLPDIGELRTNAENLLRTPLVIPRINPLETLQVTKTLGDNIWSHTENTVRNLQHSLASTLNEARINNAGEKLAKPSVDLLEMVSDAHEDMKDKLYGIHTDLKDRLETLQDHITEQTKFATLTMPRLPNILKLESPFCEPTASSNLRASQPIKSIKSQRKPGFRVNKPSQSAGQKKPVNQQVNLKPFKMSNAASSLTPKSIKVPKLTATSVKPPFAKPLERNSNVKLRKSKLNPVQEPAKFQAKSTPPISSLRPKSQSRFNSEDTSGFPSDVRYSRVTPNSRPKYVFSEPDSIQLRSSSPWQASSVKTSNDKTASVPKFNGLRVKEMSSGKLPALPAFMLPKATERPLIAKLRESLKPKLSSTKLGSEGIKLTKEMDKSASEDNAVILSQESLKENVSYKCKMVCYSDPSNK